MVRMWAILLSRSTNISEFKGRQDTRYRREHYSKQGTWSEQYGETRVYKYEYTIDL